MFNIHNVYASQRFVDIPTSHSSYEEINYLVEKGVIAGIIENGKTYYKPTQTVTRGEAAKMVVLATGNKPLKVSQSSFADIKVDSWVSGYVEQAVKLGYFTAYSGNKFEPNIGLTRNEMAKVLSIAYKLDVEKYKDLEIPFTDISKSNSYYKYIAAVYYNGIAVGTSTTKFSPTTFVTREQFALFVARASSDKYRLDLPVQGVTVPNEKDAIAKVRVTTDNLNVRSSASSATSTNILGKVHTGTILYVYEMSNDWYKVAYNGRYAYVYKTYTEIIETLNPGVTPEPEQKPEQQPEPEEPALNTKTIGSATVNNLNIRAKADASSASVAKINRGTIVAVHSISGNWAKVTYNGKDGYVNKTYLRLINQTGSAVQGRIIIIDPGHGGKDPGASKASAVEKIIVLNTANKLKNKLEAAGAIVKMTRTGDTYPTLTDRVAFAKNNYGEIFISIHVNSATSESAKGTETFYSVTNNENEKEDLALATNINNQIVKNAGMKDRGVKRADYVVIKGLTMPSVLVELGFVSNSEDRSKLVDDKYVDIFAQSIYNGVVQYYQK